MSSHRVEIGKVEKFHETTQQASVRLTVDVHEGAELVIESDGREIELGPVTIVGSDETEEGKLLAISVDEPVSEGDTVYRIVED